MFYHRTGAIIPRWMQIWKRRRTSLGSSSRCKIFSSDNDALLMLVITRLTDVGLSPLVSIKCSINSSRTDKEQRRMEKREKELETGGGQRETGTGLSQTNGSLSGLSLKPLSCFSFLFPLSLLHALPFYPFYIPFPVSLWLYLVFHFRSLSSFYSNLYPIWSLSLSLYRSIWGIAMLGHSWHNPLLPPHTEYTRHCAEWMQRASQCTRPLTLAVPGTPSKSVCPHYKPPTPSHMPLKTTSQHTRTSNRQFWALWETLYCLNPSTELLWSRQGAVQYRNPHMKITFMHIFGRRFSSKPLAVHSRHGTEPMTFCS